MEKFSVETHPEEFRGDEKWNGGEEAFVVLAHLAPSTSLISFLPKGWISHFYI